MLLELDLQISENITDALPSTKQFYEWISLALEVSAYNSAAEISLRIVDESEGRALNAQYRGKDNSTNVLSFPAEIPDFVDSDLLGDIVFCASIVETEAEQQEKPVLNHWAHLTVHGCLHLLGYDHIESDEAEAMEALEIKVLERLNIPNPYLSAS